MLRMRVLLQIICDGQFTVPARRIAMSGNIAEV